MHLRGIYIIYTAIQFWAKKLCFYTFLDKNGSPQLRRKFYKSSGKWSDWYKNWHKCFLGYLGNFLVGIFYLFPFLHFYWIHKLKKCQFLRKIGQFYIKIDFFATSVSNTKTKKQNIKNLHNKKFLKYSMEYL